MLLGLLIYLISPKTNSAGAARLFQQVPVVKD